MDCSNIHNSCVAPNPDFTNEPSGQQSHQPPRPCLQQNMPGYQPGFQPQQQSSAVPSSSSTFLGSVPPEFLLPVQQVMNEIHQLGRTLRTNAQMASLFLVFEQDQFNGLVRKTATEALLSGLYGFRAQVERIKFYNAPDDTLGVQVPMNQPITGGQYFDSDFIMPGPPITPPISTIATGSVPASALPSTPQQLEEPQNGAITSSGLNVPWVSGLGGSEEPIDLTGDDEPITDRNSETSIAIPTSPILQISLSSTSTDSNPTNSPESRKRSRDIAAIDLDAPSISSKKPKSPLSNFRMDGPPILYEHRVENYLIPYVRYYDSSVGTVRDVSYDIYKAEYGEMSTRWQKIQGELEELHDKRHRLGVWLGMEEGKRKKGGRRAEKNAGAVFGPVEQRRSSSSAATEINVGADDVVGGGGTGGKSKAKGKRKENSDDNELEPLCEQALANDGNDADDFARLVESVWDSVDPEDAAAIVSG